VNLDSHIRSKLTRHHRHLQALLKSLYKLIVQGNCVIRTGGGYETWPFSTTNITVERKLAYDEARAPNNLSDAQVHFTLRVFEYSEAGSFVSNVFYVAQAIVLGYGNQHNQTLRDASLFIGVNGNRRLGDTLNDCSHL